MRAANLESALRSGQSWGAVNSRGEISQTEQALAMLQGELCLLTEGVLEQRMRFP